MKMLATTARKALHRAFLVLDKDIYITTKRRSEALK